MSMDFWERKTVVLRMPPDHFPRDCNGTGYGGRSAYQGRPNPPPSREIIPRNLDPPRLRSTKLE